MVHNVIMPDLGQTVAEGRIVRWLKKPGEKVGKGEALLEVETDKVTMEVESYKAGYLRKILIGEGELAAAMSPIAILTDRPDEAYEKTDTGDAVRAGVSLDRASRLPGVDVSATGSGARPPLAVVATDVATPPATPAAKARARELGLDLSLLTPSRSDGLVTRRDVESAHTGQRPSRPVLPMAAVTTKSVQSIPHFSVTVDADVSALLTWRSRWNENHPESQLSLNDIFVRAAALALRDVPALNVRYSNGAVEQRTGADVLIVVAVERGLTLTTVADPTRLPWKDCADVMRQALKRAGKAMAEPLLPGGGPALAVSNLGMFGVRQFTAIIPPGSTAILAIGAVREEAVVRNRQVELGEVCTLTLAADHRVVDGITAAKFLERMQVHLKAL